MATAKAIRCARTGGPEVLEYVDVEVGDPGPGEARVRNHAIGVNFIGTYFRSGLYPLYQPDGLGQPGHEHVVASIGRRVGRVRRRLFRRRSPARVDGLHAGVKLSLCDHLFPGLARTPAQTFTEPAVAHGHGLAGWA